MDVVIVSHYTIHITLVYIILFISFWQNLSSDICLWWQLTFRKGKLWKNPCHGIIPLSSRQKYTFGKYILGMFYKAFHQSQNWLNCSDTAETSMRLGWDIVSATKQRKDWSPAGGAFRWEIPWNYGRKSASVATQTVGKYLRKMVLICRQTMPSPAINQFEHSNQLLKRPKSSVFVFSQSSHLTWWD